MATSVHALPCGCCEPPAVPTPELPGNRPALAAVRYRVGTFATFREAMLRALGRDAALAALTTRESDDAAITVLELWAAVADVLTFYQERLANEGYLRTATERDSVLRLVRLLDYHLRPGIAATTHLVFEAESDATVRIDPGLRVMSVPGQDERPVTFETVRGLMAVGRLNHLPVLPLPHHVVPLAAGRQSAFLTPDTAGWAAARRLSPGERVVLFGGSTAAPPSAGGAAGPSYGDTLGWGVPDRVIAAEGAWGGAYGIEALVGMWSVGFNAVFGAGMTHIEPEEPGAPEEKEIREIRIEGDRYLLTWRSPVTKAGWTEATEARVYRAKLRLFGHDAPARYTTVVPGSGSNPPTVTPNDISDWGIAAGSRLPLDGIRDDLAVGDELLVVEGASATVVRITGLSQAEEIMGTLPAEALADPRHRGTVTRVSVTPAVGVTDRRDATIYVLAGGPIPLWSADFSQVIESGRVCLPAAPLDPDTTAVEVGRTIVGGELVPGVPIRLDELEVGRLVMLEDHAGRPVLATLTGRSVEQHEGRDFLVLDLASEHTIRLETRTAVLHANIAPATHGETVLQEILGDGDAASPYQRFSLLKRPLTHVPSARSPLGESTLTLRVNGQRWDQVDTLYGKDASAPVYVVRFADDGTATVRFGDGDTGARLPTGRANVLATYRHGSGLEGRVRAGQLSLLLDRPVGLKAATNPAAAEGGADPETLDRARTAAPGTVRTFGRAVSLRDFEDLARESGEVARAAATWVWSGLQKAVHVTVAGQRGERFGPEALRRIHDGLTAARDPNRTLLLGNVCRVPVVVEARLVVDERFVADEVLQAANQAVMDHFDFDRMEFARAVHLSDVYRVLQDVPGVVAADVERLTVKGAHAWTAAQRAARDLSAAPVQQHVRVFAARPRPPGAADPVAAACFAPEPLPQVLPAEQAFVAVPADDVLLTVTGGLAS